MLAIETKNNLIKVNGNLEKFKVLLSTYEEKPGVECVVIRLTSEVAAVPPEVTLTWMYPDIDIHTKWNPTIGFNRGVNPDFWGSCNSKVTSGAPVEVLINYNNENKLTTAFSDALNPVKIIMGVNEETANMACSVVLFSEAAVPLKTYEGILRLDTRPVPYYESLDDVQKWWASMPGYVPCHVPEAARLPMYSTWYSFHQNVDPESIIKQCALAKELGCETVIVDDGWQTKDSRRGYAYCGDWEVEATKVPDMKKFVDEVHKLGMKFMLWYSVPFVGKYSKAWERFQGKLLYLEKKDWCVLDPRFSEVREYLINIYEKAVMEWGLDGLKLDFVDSFNDTQYSENLYAEGQDYTSIPEAVDRLLKDVISRLNSIKPDFMIEFRQSYTGPLMRTYGNMFRASDCPNDSLGNRLKTVDVRLICGNTAAHSDMLMWNYNGSVESAAMQVVNILFSVPQISVRIDKLPTDHYNMLKYWMGFWYENRELLLDGKFSALHPETNYSLVTAASESKIITAAYSETVIHLQDIKDKEIVLINGTCVNRLLFEVDDNISSLEFEVKDCCGNIVNVGVMKLNPEINSVKVPVAGMVTLKSTTNR